ncbi:hypothetical protein [Sphingomonas agri]|jgi:hypothetical protein|uniref:hypothetical protein n=1 Tax=Sphingomonas agri TaxID=1813878 RepID=UPI0031202E4C
MKAIPSLTSRALRGLGGMGRAHMESDAVYYSRRAREERQAAFGAAQKKVRDRHLEFALAYELRTRFLLGDPPVEIVIEPFLIRG